MGLDFLPDKVLPEMDSPLLNLLDAFEDNQRSHQAAELIERYASPAIAGAVSLFLGQHLGDHDCSRRLPLLGYLLRVQPELAAPYLAPTQQPYPQGCGENSLASRLKRQN